MQREKRIRCVKINFLVQNCWWRWTRVQNWLLVMSLCCTCEVKDSITLNRSLQTILWHHDGAIEQGYFPGVIRHGDVIRPNRFTFGSSCRGYCLHPLWNWQRCEAFTSLLVYRSLILVTWNDVGSICIIQDSTLELLDSQETSTACKLGMLLLKGAYMACNTRTLTTKMRNGCARTNNLAFQTPT